MNRIQPGDPRNAGVLDANFQELLGIVGALTDANIASAAGINGSKLALNSMPGNRIVNGSIAQAQMGALSVGAPQIINGDITGAKVTTTVGSRLKKANLELKLLAGTAGFSIGGGNTGFAFIPHIAQQVVGGTNSWVIKCKQSYVIGGFSGIATSADVTIVPGTAIPVATTTPIGLVWKNPVFAAGGGQIDLELHYIEN